MCFVSRPGFITSTHTSNKNNKHINVSLIVIQLVKALLRFVGVKGVKLVLGFERVN